jgi:hypothetical protein
MPFPGKQLILTTPFLLALFFAALANGLYFWIAGKLREAGVPTDRIITLLN